MSKVQEKRMEFVKELVELMESGKLEWSPGHDLPIHDLNVTTGKSYRGGNVLRLWKSARDQGFKDPRWMTFKQAKDKGYVLKKGSKGTWLEKYQPNTIKEVENKETGEKEAKVLPGFWK